MHRFYSFQKLRKSFYIVHIIYYVNILSIPEKKNKKVKKISINDPNANRKHINVRDTTYNKLLDIGKMSESMDDLINRLIIGYDDNKYMNQSIK